MNGHLELEESIEAILAVIKAVKDSLNQSNVLGSLVCQETFTFNVQHKQRSRKENGDLDYWTIRCLFFRSKKQGKLERS